MPVCSLVMCLGNDMVKPPCILGKTIVQGGGEFVECVDFILGIYALYTMILIVIMHYINIDILAVSTEFYKLREIYVTFFKNNNFTIVERISYIHLFATKKFLGAIL